jgi:hypothetical protein
MYYHAGRGVGIRSESGYIMPKKLGFAVISNVIPTLNDEQMKQIDFTKICNQVDIYFLVNHVLRSTVACEALKVKKDVNMSNNNTAQ